MYIAAESEIENDDSNFEDTDPKPPKRLNIATTTYKMYNFVTKGTALAKQFPYVLPKLLLLAKSGKMNLWFINFHR